MTHPLIQRWTENVNAELAGDQPEIRTSYSTLASPPYRWMCWAPEFGDEGPLAFAEHEHVAIAKLKRALEERLEEPF